MELRHPRARCGAAPRMAFARLLRVGAQRSRRRPSAPSAWARQSAQAPGRRRRRRRQAQQQLPLLVVENPDEIPVVREVRHERGGLDAPGRGLERRPRARRRRSPSQRNVMRLDRSIRCRFAGASARARSKASRAPRRSAAGRGAARRGVADVDGDRGSRRSACLKCSTAASQRPERLLGKRPMPRSESGSRRARASAPSRTARARGAESRATTPVVDAERHVPLRPGPARARWPSRAACRARSRELGRRARCWRRGASWQSRRCAQACAKPGSSATACS